MATGRLPKHRLDTGAIFRVSEKFLSLQHYADCRDYAKQVFEIQPNFPGVSEIIAVADVLLASKNQISPEIPHDWYAILQLDRFTNDSDVINQRFNHLYGILSPDKNKFPFADKAFDLVNDAWFVLSNRERKLEFDDLVRRVLKLNVEESSSSFWTVCPYCYYVYEFPRVYLEHFLMCPNENCSKVFTSVEINRPPVEVLTQGKYCCSGFSPLGFQFANWSPFELMKKQEAKISPDASGFVEISDDDDKEDEIERNREKNVKDEEHVETMKKQPVRRMKMVAKRTKKVTGVGNRVTKQETDVSGDSPDTDNDDDQTNVGGVEFF